MTPSTDPNRVLIFDTTLRDGEQSPGCSMNLNEKLEIAHALKDLGVDVIEAGFPIASPGDFESVQEIARQVHGPVICGLARCNPADIDRAAEAVKESSRPRVHVFLATSAIHREFKLRMTPEEVVRRAVEGVKRAKGYVDDVEFSPEDAARTELNFLSEVVEKAIEAGATTLNIPDTVGYAVPTHYANVIRHLKKTVRGIDDVVLSVHCHNDLGLAVANTLAALHEGARQVECTINGIGERAGNTALEEVVMALRTRQDFYGLTTGINTRFLFSTSRKLSHVTGMQVQRNKAIVGQNAFAHEAGIHQDGMLKERSTYEIMRPEDLGIPKTELVLGKHSGRHALRQRIVDLGYHLTDDQLNKVFDAFKALADRKKEVYDADIEALAENQLHNSSQKMWTLQAFTCNAGTGTLPSAAVCLWRSDGTICKDAAVGDGPVDAVFKALDRITGTHIHVVDYRIRAVTIGTDAQGEAYVEADHGGRRMSARAVSTDIVEASAMAYLEIINRLVSRQTRDRLKPTDHVPQELVPAN
ncbi:2-isopropylmalate synthase [Fimbriiglobus ruber]|uniref:2-isopropylmalate synthase n=1 Tax=Fimbriiglobus ruber TaxID=1908690 RepID=A0A225DIQ2_9BACT|nr:2-isopropylmalate synthase [Fimbriiglobus ruber]OWK36255.1 2-isopropylmalate synthase [Fimbriiglobus ruber]